MQVASLRGEGGEELQMVIFKLGDETFGVDVHQVREIIKMKEYTRIPNAPPYIRGVINLRGQITVIIDLQKIFNMRSGSVESSDSRIIIVDAKDANVGIMVDAVLGVTRIQRKNVEPPPLLSKSKNLEFIKGIAKHGENLVIIIDLEQLLSHIKNTEASTVEIGGEATSVENPGP
ncbi:MAG: chemotaxis protein CheW [Thermoprotei archaeon]|mgnify:CR=1 FL=1|nr:MAG: chemotaxis protein CheW [Thermoprotei archaeon]